MPLDELTEDLSKRAIVSFPILATVEEVERLFCYLRQEEGTTIDYFLTLHKKIGNQLAEAFELEFPGVLGKELHGNMYHPTIDQMWDFSCPHRIADDGATYFVGIFFFQVPGWDLSEYAPKTFELWDRVRKLTNEYFELRKPKQE